MTDKAEVLFGENQEKSTARTGALASEPIALTWDELNDLDSALGDSVSALERQAEHSPLDDTDMDYVSRAVTLRLKITDLMHHARMLVQERDTLREHAEIDHRMHRSCCRERAALSIENQRLRDSLLTENESDYGLGVLQSHHKGLVDLRMAIPVVLKSLLAKLRVLSQTEEGK